MLLSVAIYHHKLTFGQWIGAAVVFAGISVEAYVKRRGMSPSRSVSTAALAARRAGALVCESGLFLVLSSLLCVADVHAKRVIQEKEKPRIKSL